MRARSREEQGFVVVTATMVIAMLLVIGLGAFAFINTQQRAAGGERTRESAFNLAEAALRSQLVYLSSHWPTSSYGPCDQTTGLGNNCPDPATVAAGATNVDYGGAPRWTTEVHDDLAPSASYYDDTTTRAQVRYDSNHDRAVWVRAQATAQGRTRTVVALVKRPLVPLPFPQNAVTAGTMATGNAGRKRIADLATRSSRAGSIAVRCSTAAPAKGNSCLNYDPNKGQVVPDVHQTAYAGGDALSDANLAMLKQLAIDQGTYVASGCPASYGGIVYIEQAPAGGCSVPANTIINPAVNGIPNPGLLVIASGSMSFGANSVYNGLVYAANRSNPRATGTLVNVGGNAQVVGAIAADGDGAGVQLGESGDNFVFDLRVFGLVQGYGSAQVATGTFREVVGRP